MAIKIKYLLLIFCLAPINAKVFLIFGGKTGWIGKKIMSAVAQQGHEAIAAQSRLENSQDVENEIIAINPDFIINAAGAIGKINVDWCEDNKQETLRANFIGALILADISFKYGIHLTNIGTGCIYNYDAEHPIYSGKGFTEEDTPNFEDAFYTKTKIMLEKLLMYYSNVLNLRVRLPIASDYHRRNLFVKLTKYEKVVNMPNSITVLDDLVPLIPEMALRGLTGIYNFVNPGIISHNEILDLYALYLDPTFIYQNFTIEEQNEVLKSKRGYNQLDVAKLLQEFPDIIDVKESIKRVFKRLQ